MNKMVKCLKAARLQKFSRTALQVAGSIPYVGGVLSAIAGNWSENEQKNINHFFEYWIKMINDEIKEKENTILEIIKRLDMQDKTTSDRVESKEYQSLVKKAFREWSGAESELKREYIRNILSNAASTNLSSDDVIKMYI
jgi:hypothetical protein